MVHSREVHSQEKCSKRSALLRTSCVTVHKLSLHADRILVLCESCARHLGLAAFLGFSRSTRAFARFGRVVCVRLTLLCSVGPIVISRRRQKKLVRTRDMTSNPNQKLDRDSASGFHQVVEMVRVKERICDVNMGDFEIDRGDQKDNVSVLDDELNEASGD